MIVAGFTLIAAQASYAEIAQAVGRSPKSVDNAVQRIRRKTALVLSRGDGSES